MADAFWPGVPNAAGTEIADIRFDGPASVRDGAVVVGSLWPSLEARAAMKPGDTFELTPIDRVTLSEGAAQIHVADSALLRSHQSGDAAVVLHLDLYTNYGSTVILLERTPGASGRWTSSDAPESTAPTRLTIDESLLAKAPIPTVDTSTGPILRDHEGSLQCSAMTSDPSVTATETVQVAGVYKGVVAGFTYTSSASTASGMGVQIGTGLQWSQNSLATRSSSLTATYATQTGPSTAWAYREWRANWLHLRYWRHCPLTPDPGYRTERFTEPYKVNGFPTTITSRYPDVPCASRNDLSGVTSIATDNTTGMQYDQAFAITYGSATFKGSSKSNFTSAVKMKFTRPSGFTGYWYWCGDNVVAQDSHWVKAGRL